MRYTSVVDIREWPSVYTNKSCRLLYLHICLAAGYQSYNKGVLVTTYRQLADEAGLTLSATRFAMGKLIKAGLVKGGIGKRRYPKQLVLIPLKKISKEENRS